MSDRMQMIFNPQCEVIHVAHVSLEERMMNT